MDANTTDAGTTVRPASELTLQEINNELHELTARLTYTQLEMIRQKGPEPGNMQQKRIADLLARKKVLTG